MQVTLSEELIGNATELLYPMRTGNHYRSIWTTGEGPESVFEHHEYMLFRYAEVEVYNGYNSTATCAEQVPSAALSGFPLLSAAFRCFPLLSDALCGLSAAFRCFQ